MNKIFDWAESIGCAVTVCDLEGIILYQNERARKTYESHGDLIGKNVFDCHPAHAAEKIRHMLATDTTNAYTIEKNGVHKLIFQSPWHRDGKVAGMVEISIPTPAEMPHYVRR